VTLSPDATLEYLWQGESQPLYLRGLVEYDTGSERLPALEAKADRYARAGHPEWFVLLLVTTGGPQRLGTLLHTFRALLPESVIIAGAPTSHAFTDPQGPVWIRDGRGQSLRDLAAPVRVPEGLAVWGTAIPTRPRDTAGRFA
jgi:hypothetical protein